MPQSLGTIWAEVGLKLDKLNQGLKEAEAKIKQADDQFGKVTKSFKQVGTVTTGAGVAVAAGLGFAVKMAASFEKEMSNAKAVSGASAEEMERLTKLAKQMGIETKYSSAEAAKGMTELLKAGLTPAQVEAGALQAALAMAAAGDIELADAAEIAANALNAFNLQAKDMNMVADVMAGAANASATDIGELKYALSMSSAVAAQAGLSFQDTTTALAVLAQRGLKGSDAGTSLKTMLMRLSPSTDAAAKAMKQLGLMTENGTSAFYNGKGELKSFSEISGLLQTSLENLTPAQKQMALQTIFGADAIRAAAIFTEAGAEGFDDMAAAMGKVTAADVAKEKMNNLSGSLEYLKGSMETAGITIGETFIPLIRKIADIVAWLANKFLKLSPSVQKTIGIIAGIAAVFLLVVGPILLLIGFIPSIIAGFTALGAVFTALGTILGVVGGAFSLLLSPIGLIIAAVAALAYGVYQLIKNWSTVQTFFTDLWARVSESFENAKKMVVEKAKAIATGLWQGLQSMAGWLREKVWGWIKSVIPDPIEKILGIASPSKLMAEYGRLVAEGLAEGVNKNVSKVKEAAQKMVDAIKGAADTMLRKLDLSLDITEKKFKLYELQMGKAANVLDRFRMKKDLMLTQLATVADQVQILTEAYNRLAKAQGAESTEALEMYSKLLDMQIKSTELHTQLGDVVGQERRMKENVRLLEAGAAGKTVVNNVIVNNPKPETAGDSTRRELLRLQYMGAFS
jgi:TP901 family phage tail tape measure protein